MSSQEVFVLISIVYDSDFLGNIGCDWYMRLHLLKIILNLICLQILQ